MPPPSARRREPVSADARGRLSRGQVVDAALQLADREGLDALTIRKLAVDLGVTPMALYWHVADKDELLDALGERMFANVELPDRVDDWFADLRGVAAAIITALRRHPAVAPLALPTVLTNEAGVVLAERVLSRLSDAGFTDREAANVGAFLLGAMVTLVTALPGGPPGEQSGADMERARRKHAHLFELPPERFPAVTRMAGKLVECDDPDDYLARGLDVLMLGVRGLAASGEQAG